MANTTKNQLKTKRKLAASGKARTTGRVGAKSPGPRLIVGGLHQGGMEGVLAGMFGPRGAGPGRRRRGSAVDHAQQLIYQAWEAGDDRTRVTLAQKALATSRDCADAYVILADYATTRAEERRLFEEAVAAGERALGADFFEENVGHFWGLLETRPYMRARAALAAILWDMGEREAAVRHYQELLRLNPNDNQGNRQILVGRLLELGRDAEVATLLDRFQDDASAWMIYARALASFRSEGDSGAARDDLAAALKANPHVPAYLLGRKKPPRTLPQYHGFGDASEAASFAANGVAAWQAAPGAAAWLAALAEPRPSGRRARR